jgi:voltage-gated sodium channel
MKAKVTEILYSKPFEWFIIITILVNCTLIGVETYFTNPVIGFIQSTALVIFTIEIIIRWFAKQSVRLFFTDPWNVFDLMIVIVSLIPESVFTDASTITVIRVLRVFRVLRLIRTSEEVKLIVSVLFRSFRSLTYNSLFFFIFTYLFAIMGVILFRLPDYQTATPEIRAKLELHAAEAPNAPSVSPDPYGTLAETFFTLFRILTGEDWTDLRYNLIHAKKLGLIQTSEVIITTFHTVWYIFSAFLLLNLLVGAIINNYQVIMDEQRKRKELQNQAKIDFNNSL